MQVQVLRLQAGRLALVALIATNWRPSKRNLLRFDSAKLNARLQR